MVQAVDKIHRAVDGVDNPNVFVCEVVCVFFFHEEAAIGQEGSKSAAQELLHRYVGSGDDVGDSVFLGNLKVVGEHQG